MLEVTGTSIVSGILKYSFSDGSTAVLKSVRLFTGQFGLSADSSVTDAQWKAIQAYKAKQKGNVL